MLRPRVLTTQHIPILADKADRTSPHGAVTNRDKTTSCQPAEDQHLIANHLGASVSPNQGTRDSKRLTETDKRRMLRDPSRRRPTNVPGRKDRRQALHPRLRACRIRQQRSKNGNVTFIPNHEPPPAKKTNTRFPTKWKPAEKPKEKTVIGHPVPKNKIEESP